MPIDDVLSVKRRLGVTLNDVCLAMASGALRDLALARGESPRPLKAMVPVSLRSAGDDGSLGNRVSFAFIDLPLDVASPERRLARVHTATAAFKRGGSRRGRRRSSAPWDCCPIRCATSQRRPSRTRASTTSRSRTSRPRAPLYMLGAELIESHPVVPIAEGHALSIGIFSYRDTLGFGLYADPDAFPQVDDLPQTLDTSLRELLLPRG